MNAKAALSVDRRHAVEQTYAWLSHFSLGIGVADALAKMLASQTGGIGCMPTCLGLEQESFEGLLGWYFPGVAPAPLIYLGSVQQAPREEEFAELRELFLAHATPSEESGWMATILAAGCMGDDHLWQDMGFWSRSDLSGFISRAFPALAAKNERDMKWKKFFYKQLCNQAGVYTCRAPSCEVCADYAACFGPEE